jgi:pimeloyl-ACP methyl ester carboxylesterase
MALPFDPRSGFAEHAIRAAMLVQGFRRRHVATSAGRVHVLRAEGTGELPPIALLHGFSSSGVHFFSLLQHLRRQVRALIVPDLPAHGFSDTPADLDPSALESGLFEALDASLDEPAILYGNSMGGLAALRYALKRPERVLGLVLCSPVGAPMNDAEIRRFRRRFQLESHSRAVAFVDRVFALDGGPMRHLLAWGVRRKFGHPAMRALIDSLAPGDLLAPGELDGLAAPVLFVWGRCERVLPAEHREYFLEHLPEGTLVEEPPRFGHGPYLSHPEAAAVQILDFARALPEG